MSLGVGRVTKKAGLQRMTTIQVRITLNENEGKLLVMEQIFLLPVWIIRLQEKRCYAFMFLKVKYESAIPCIGYWKKRNVTITLLWKSTNTDTK